MVALFFALAPALEAAAAGPVSAEIDLSLGDRYLGVLPAPCR